MTLDADDGESWQMGVNVYYFTRHGTAVQQATVPKIGIDSLRFLVEYIEDILGIVESVRDFGDRVLFQSAVRWDDVYDP